MLGVPANLEEISEIAKKHGIPVIEDTAWGCGGYYKKIPLGTYGDIGTFSFDFAKTMTTGEGGMLVFNDENLYRKAVAWHDHGHENNPNLPRWEDSRSSSGFNYRMSELQGAVGIAQLKKLDFFVKARQQIASRYDQSFANVGTLKMPNLQDKVKHAYHLYPLLMDFQKRGTSKLEFFKKMKGSGINLQVHYIPVHLQPFYRKKFGFQKGAFPVSEQFYEQEVSLPIYPRLAENDSEKVKKIICEVVS